MKNIIDILSDLKARGIGLSLDDAGQNLKLKGNIKDLTAQDKAVIKQHKSDILLLLKKTKEQQHKTITAVSKSTSYPLSPAQRRIWVLSQFAQGNVAYNMFSSYLFEGTLNIVALQQAFQSLIARHEILRTIFKEDKKGNINQFVQSLDEFNFQIEFKNLSAEKAALVVAKNHAAIDGQWIFNLETGPLLRVVLYQLNSNKWILTCNMHHIISDGWSVGIFVQDLLKAYQQYNSNQANHFTPLKIQYKDYASWIRQQLDSEALKQSKKYWLDQLKGDLPVLSLVGDYIRPKTKTYNGNTCAHIIDADRSKQFKLLCQSQGATLFMGALSIVNILLYKYTGQNDIIIGSPIAGRNHVDIENQLGVYINTLVLRNQFNGADSFIDLLKNIKKTTLNAYTHQSYPFDELVDQLSLSHDRSRSAIFDVMLVLQNNEQQDIEFAFDDLKITRIEEEDKTSKLDLQFDFIELDQQLQIKLNYNTDIYKKETAEQLLTHLVQLISAVINQSTVSLKALDFLNQQEKQHLIEGLNNTHVSYSKDKTIVDLFEEQVTKTPNAIALVYKERSFTYAQLDETSNQLAHFLTQQKDLSPEDLIGVKLDRTEWLLISLLAILKSGCAYVPIDKDYPAERIAFIEKDSHCKFTIDESLLDLFLSNQEKYKTNYNKQTIAPNQLAYVIYTSGSTGKPKGVMIEHANAVSLIHWSMEEYMDSEFDLVYAVTSHCFDLSIYEFFYSLSVGKKIRLLHNALEIESYLDQDKKVLINTVPSVVKTLLEKQVSLENISVLNMAGEPIPVELIAQLPLDQIEVRNLYGPSEDTTYSSCFRILQNYKVSVPIGKPISNTQFYILSEDLQLQPKGIIGELCISGEGLARGYLNRTNLTAEKFVTNPFDQKTKMYRTGDLAKWMPDGNLAFFGRKDHQVKIRGYRIELGEIEIILNELETIDEAVVIAKENTKKEQEIVAYLKSDSKLDISELRAYLNQKLPAYMVPLYYVQLTTFPLTSNGKLDRKKLPDPAELSLATRTEYIAPKTKNEKALATVWTNILQVDRVGMKDDFFDLGGHSLKMARLSSKVHQLFNTKVAFEQLYEYSTLEQMLKLIEATDKSSFTNIPLAPISTAYPLSSSQRRIWVLSQFKDGNIAYNIPAVYLFEGQLNQNSLSFAFEQLIDRHEALRTIFKQDEDGQIKQVILNSNQLNFSITCQDERAININKAGFNQKIHTELAKAFDLSSGPLLRANLYQLADNKWVFAFVMHHIISDGWSVELLIKELLHLYNIHQNGLDETPLTPLSTQYKDYAVWQQQALNGGSLKAHKDYWLKQFEGVIPVLQLSTDYPRPAVKSYNGANVKASLDLDLSNKVKALCQDQGVTLFMGLLAITNTLLYKYTQQEDIIIGSPIAGRKHNDLDNQIGVYINTLALRTRFNASNNFIDLLSKIKTTTLSAYEHQLFPFDELVDALDLKRDMSRNALFDVMVVLNNMQAVDISRKNIALDNLQISPYERFSTDANAIGKFDLSFDFTDDQAGIQVNIEYNKDIFNQQTIERMSNHLSQLITSILTTPNLPIQALNYIPESEQQQLLFDLNNTTVDYGNTQTIIDLFKEQVAKTPNQTALIFEEKQLSYKTLDDQSTRLACYLQQEYNIQREDFIGIQLPRTEYVVISMLAILKSGGAYVAIDKDYPEDRINYILKDSQCKLVIDQNEIEHFKSKPSQNFDELILNKASSADLAYLIYTSGSSGQPKGVMIEHHSLLDYAKTFADKFLLNQHDRVIQQASISFDTHVEEIYPSLISGATLLMGKNGGRDVNEIIDLIQKKNATVLSATPILINELNKQNIALNNIRLLISGGDKFNANMVSNFIGKTAIYDSYGPSESTVCATFFEIKNTDTIGIIGKPIANRKVYILDDQMRLQGIGLTGEICISGAGLARGYLNQTDLTNQQFIANPFVEGERLYKTGDIGKYLDNGNIEFIGRKDKQIKLRGYRIELGEIEQQLNQIPELGTIVVTLKQQSDEEAILIAYFTGASTIDIDYVRTQLGQKLPTYMLPRHYIQLAEFPLTPNGKVDKKQLPQPEDMDLQNSTKNIAARNKVERTLVTIWKEILNLEAVSVKDNFFDLGGHSLKLTRLASRLLKEFKIKVPYEQLFAEAVLEDQAKLIQSARQSNFISIPKAPASLNYPLSPAQHSLWMLSQFEEKNVAYNMPGVFEFIGALNFEALEQSFIYIIQRHEILRTFFKENEAGEIRQYIKDPKEIDFTIQYHNFSKQTNQDQKVKAFIETELIQAFNFSKAPLLRSALIKLEPNKHLFIYTMHHIISDAWSINLMMEEIIHTYNLIDEGQTIDLAVLNIQYKDYAVWLNGQIQNKTLDTQAQYWEKQLAGEIQAVQFDYDRPNTATTSYKGNSLLFELKESTIQKIQELIKKEAITEFVFHLSTIKSFLFLYTQQEDIVLGVPIAGRGHIDLEDQLGYYVNFLPMRSILNKEESFISVCDRIKTSVTEALNNQMYPIDLLIKQLNFKRVANNTGFINTGFSWIDTDTNQIKINDELDVLVKPIYSKTAKYDFLMVSNPKQFIIEYREDLFNETSIQLFAERYQAFLAAVVADPTMELGAYNYATDAEKEIENNKINIQINF